MTNLWHYGFRSKEFATGEESEGRLKRLCVQERLPIGIAGSRGKKTGMGPASVNRKKKRLCLEACKRIRKEKDSKTKGPMWSPMNPRCYPTPPKDWGGGEGEAV